MPTKHAKRNKIGIRAGAVIVVAIVLGSQWWMRARTNNADAQPEADAPDKPIVVKPEPPRTWVLGSLTLKPCELAHPGSATTAAAWCAPFHVPEDYAKPDGRKIDLHMAMIKSASPTPKKDIVVLLAGGPGQAATEVWPQTKAALTPLRKHHNILLLDQRGTGQSNPLTCPDDDKAKPDMDDLGALQGQLKACLKGVSKDADPRLYTTTDAIKDLESVRKALGSPKFDLVGVSYGTRVAQQYMRDDPSAIRSAVLDSVVPNTMILGETFASSLQSALKKQFAACIATPACKRRFGDPSKTLRTLRAAVAAKPMTATITNPVTGKPVERTLNPTTLASVVRLFAYTPETAALLPLGIDQAAHGQPQALLAQGEIISQSLAKGMNGGMQFSVVCAEDADQLKARPEDANTLLGNHLIKAFKAACDVWPHGTRPANFHAPLHTEIPVLLMAGSLDPVTPPKDAKKAMEGMSDARLLVAKGQGHNVMGRGCMPRLMATFVDTKDPKSLDTKCLSKLGPTPAFISGNGAAP